MAGNKEPRWQPIRALPLLMKAIDGLREAAEAQHQNLQEARQRLYILDDATVGRVIRVFTTPANALWLYEEQLARWQQTPLSTTHRRAVERLSDQLTQLRTVVQNILALAQELQTLTIEKVLEMSDEEVALAALSGKVKR